MTGDEMRQAYIEAQVMRLALEPDKATRDRMADELVARVKRLFPMSPDELMKRRQERI